MMVLATVFATLNVFLLAGLLFLYGRIFQKSKSIYTIGLVVFALALLFQNAMTLFAYFMMAPFFEEGVLPYLLAATVFEFASVGAVFGVTVGT
ncbi:MAG TPA: hypothetical protein VEC02_00990 [Nitrososphaerales archaeon]|nr:hypothetical protein [Nitrososphaerales archaeon]